MKRIAKNWNNCEKYLNELDCIEPNAKALENDKKVVDNRESLKAKFNLNKVFDPYDWKGLRRAHRMLCEIAKIRSKINPFGLWF